MQVGVTSRRSCAAWTALALKYERVYLKACDSVNAARADIADYLHWYNTYSVTLFAELRAVSDV